jgi:hypothetical protein
MLSRSLGSAGHIGKNDMSLDQLSNIDWKQFHSFAQEAELWSSLAINTWLILGGIIFLFMNRKSSPLDELVGAGGWSLIIVFFYFAALMSFFAVANPFDIVVSKRLTLALMAAVWAVLALALLRRIRQ